MAQNSHARFHAEPPADRLGHRRTGAAVAGVVQGGGWLGRFTLFVFFGLFVLVFLVFFAVLQSTITGRGWGFARLKPGPFRNGHDAEPLAAAATLRQVLANAVDVVGNFRNEDDVGAPRESGRQGEPTGLMTHQLDHHGPEMGLGR